MKYDFITIGGTTRDISFFTNKGVLIKNPKSNLLPELLAFEYGSKIKVNRFNYSYGGGAANSAVCLSNFAFKVACISALGKDESGELIKKNLKNRGVLINLLKIEEGQESGVSFILVTPSGERIIFAQRGANYNLTITAKDLEEIKKAKNIYIASLAGSWLNNLRKIFSSISKEKQNVYWNPGMTQLLNGAEKISKFIKKVTVLAMNKDEALQLLFNSKSFSNYDKDYFLKEENIVKAVHSLGAKVTVITLGPRGVIVYDGNKIYRKSILKEKKRKDTTGIGDIFNSSFAAGYFKYQGNIEKSLNLALRNAAAKVAYLGAQDGLLKFKK